MRHILQRTFAIALIGFGPATSAMAASDPTGEGPPDSKSCRRGDIMLGSTIPGPSACLTNAQWIALHAKNQTIGPDGRTVISARGTSYYRNQDHFMDDDRDMVPRGAVTPGTP